MIAPKRVAEKQPALGRWNDPTHCALSQATIPPIVGPRHTVPDGPQPSCST